MNRRHPERVAVILWVLLLPSSALGQEGVDLTASDTAEIWTVALDTIRQATWRPFSADDVIWLKPGYEAAWGARSESILNALLERFPDIRYVEQSEELFECPPGVELRMPGQGCPIREEGRIIWFGPTPATRVSISAERENLRVTSLYIEAL